MLKNSFLLLVFLFQFLTVFGDDFFSDSGNSDPNDLNNWWTANDNTGTHPTTFTDVNDFFRIQVGHSYTTTADWTVGRNLRIDGELVANHNVSVGRNLLVASTGAGLKLSAGVVVTVSNNITNDGDVTFLGDAELIVGRNYSNSGTLMTFNPSKVVYESGAASSIIKTGTYHHLTIDATNTNTRGGILQGDIIIEGDLYIEQGTLDCDQYQITGNSTGIFSVASTGRLILGDEASINDVTLPTNFTEPNTIFDPASIITFASDFSQTIPVDETYGTLIISSGSSLTKSIAGDLIATDLIVSSNAALDLGAFTHNISDDLTVESTASLSISSGTVNVIDDLTVDGTLNLTTGTLDVDGNISGSGDVNITSSGNINVAGNFNNTGTLSAASGSTVTYDGPNGANRTLKSTTYDNLIINKTTASSELDLNGDVTVNGDLTIMSGYLNTLQYSITGNATGALSVSDGARLNLGLVSDATPVELPSNFIPANTTFGTTSRVSFLSNTAQSIPTDVAYGNLYVNSDGAITKTITGDLTVANNLVIQGSSTLDLSTFTSAVANSVTNSSTLSVTSGILNVGNNMTNTNVISLGSGTITIENDLTATSGAVSITTGTLDVDGDITGAADINITSTGNINIAANFDNTGTLSTVSGSTVTYDGISGANRTLKSAIYHNLIINKSVSTSELGLNGDVTVNGDLTIASGDLATNQYSITGNLTGTLSIAAGEKLTLGLTTNTNAVEFPSNFTNLSIDPTSIVQYNSNASHDISNVPTYGNLVLNSGSTVTKTASGDITVVNDFTINSPVIFDLGANLLDIEEELEVNGTLTASIGTIDAESDISGTGNITFTNAGNVFIAGSFSNTGTFTPSSSTVTYDGTNGIVIKDTDYNNLIIDKAIGVNANVSNDILITGDLTVKNGDLRINTSGVNVMVSGTTTVEGDAIIESNQDAAGFILGALSMTGGKIGGTGTTADFSATSLSVTGTTNEIASSDLIISGATIVDGDLSFSSAVGKKTFNDITVNGSWTTNANASTIIEGNVINNGDLNSILGEYSFTGISKTFSGSSTTMTFNEADFSGSYTNMMDSLIVTDSLSGTGSLTNGTNSVLVLGDDITINTLNATANPNTVIYNSLKTTDYLLTDYHHLIVDMPGNRNLNTPGGTSNINGDLTITGGDFRLDTLSIINVSGSTLIDADGEIGSDSSVANNDFPDVNLQDLIVRDGGRIGGGFDRVVIDASTLTMTGSTNSIRNAELTIRGVTNITGDVEITSNTGVKTFQDDVIINGSWTHATSRGTIVMDSDLIVNGTFEADSASFTFTGPSKQLGGTITRMTLRDATFTGTYTNNIDTLFMAEDLLGSGSLTNAANMRLEISDDATISTLIATAVPNTVVYFGDGTEGNQDGKETDYYDLIINNRGDDLVTFNSDMSVINHLHVKQGTYELNVVSSRLTGAADLTIESGASFEIATRNTFASPIPELTGTYTLDVNSTMEFDGNGASDIRTEEGISGNDITYGHLICSGGNSKNLTGDIDIDGNLTIESTTYLDQTTNNYTINLAGDWTSTTTNATYSLRARTGKVILDGSTNQSISVTGRSEEQFYDLVLKNNGNTVLLNGDIVVGNTLEFETDGYLNLLNNELLINDWQDGDIINASLSRFMIGGSNSSFAIDGVDPGETAIFPLSFSSSVTDYCGLEIMNNDASADEFKLTTSNYINEEGTSSGGTVITDETVDITYFITSNSTDANLTFFWDTSNELPLFDRVNCFASHFGTAWKDFGGGQSATNVSGSIYSLTANATEFSPFGIGSGTSPLPIELLSFEPTLVKNQVKLEWATATEINNDYFVIERSSDLNNWLTINQTNGVGNSLSIVEYLAFDETPLNGIAYYRLKQVDVDGTFSYSDIKTIESNDSNAISYYPNPVFDDFLFLILNDETVNSVEIYNSLNNLVKEVVINEYTDLIKIDVSDLQPQVYLLKVESDTFVEQLSVIIK